MATHKSAEKRARQSRKRRLRNREVKSRVQNLVRSLRASLASGDGAEAQTRLREAERALRRAASKGAIPKRRASRSVSRLAKRVHRAPDQQP